MWTIHSFYSDIGRNKMAEKKFIIDNGFSTDADSEITGNLSVSGTIDAGAVTVNGSPLAGGTGASKVPTTSTTPENPVSGDQWFNTNTLTLYVYYVDSNSVGAWVEVGGA